MAPRSPQSIQVVKKHASSQTVFAQFVTGPLYMTVASKDGSELVHWANGKSPVKDTELLADYGAFREAVLSEFV